METLSNYLIHRRLSCCSDTGGYKHAACIFNKRSTLSYGQNYCLTNSPYNSVHAEQDAIKNLPTNSKKHPKRVELLVVRASKTGKLGTSKPCSHCIKSMHEFARHKGYYISHVHYSTNDGYIVKQKLSDVDSVLSGFFRYRNNPIQI